MECSLEPGVKESLNGKKEVCCGMKEQYMEAGKPGPGTIMFSWVDSMESLDGLSRRLLSSD